MKKIVLSLLAAFSLFAADLSLKEGSLFAHTEMLMDSTIDPINKSLHADISMQDDDITTIRGKFWVEMSLFKSDKSDRDEHMYKSVEADKFKFATYQILNIKKDKEGYIIDGELDFHGVKKPLIAKANIDTKVGSLDIEATSKLLVSDFGIEMPCMVFMCVRDQVDIVLKAKF